MWGCVRGFGVWKLENGIAQYRPPSVVCVIVWIQHKNRHHRHHQTITIRWSVVGHGFMIPPNLIYKTPFSDPISSFRSAEFLSSSSPSPLFSTLRPLLTSTPLYSPTYACWFYTGLDPRACFFWLQVEWRVERVKRHGLLKSSSVMDFIWPQKYYSLNTIRPATTTTATTPKLFMMTGVVMMMMMMVLMTTPIGTITKCVYKNHRRRRH